MPDLAKKTFGTKLKRGEVYVAKLLNIDPPESSRDDIDVTNHDSPNGVREFVPGLIDGGEVPIEGHLIPTNDTQKSLAAAIYIDEPEPWVIEFPTNPVLRISFQGYVKAFKVGAAAIDGALTFTATIKVTGTPVIETDISSGLTALVLTGSDSGALALAPAFDNETYEYFANAANADAAVTVTPTAAGHTITVNGADVQSGEPSGNIALVAGEMKAITISAQEPDKAAVVYTLKVYREV